MSAHAFLCSTNTCYSRVNISWLWINIKLDTAADCYLFIWYMYGLSMLLGLHVFCNVCSKLWATSSYLGADKFFVVNIYCAVKSSGILCSPGYWYRLDPFIGSEFLNPLVSCNEDHEYWVMGWFQIDTFCRNELFLWIFDNFWVTLLLIPLIS